MHCSNEFPRIHYTPKEDTGGSGIDLCKGKEGPETKYCNPEDGQFYDNECIGLSYDKDSSFCDVRDGQIYKFRHIYEQIWMAQNLNYDNKRAADSRCYEDENMDDSCNEYGRFYNWEAASGICPPGWHLPSREEWVRLRDNVGRIYTKVAEALKATYGWNSYNGDDNYGFSALPGGYCTLYSCSNAKIAGMWWTGREMNNQEAYHFWIDNNGTTSIMNTLKVNLIPVRCVKDN